MTTGDQTFYEHSNCHGGEVLTQEFPVSTMSRAMQTSFGSLSTVGMEGYEDTADAGYDFPGEPGAEVREEKFRFGEDEIVWQAPQMSPADYCLRSMNGTKMFQRKPDGSQIHEFVFPLSPNCKPLDYVGYHWYAYTVGHCYMMKTPGFSFRWYTIKGTITAGLASLAGLLASLFVLS